MAKIELETRPTDAIVEDFINSLEDETQKKDSRIIDQYMQEIVGEKPKMWGTSIIGYGQEQIKYASGRELDWMRIGFSPRKQNVTLYVLNGGPERYNDLLNTLGKHKVGKGCLYIKRLSDIDQSVLKKIIKRAIRIGSCAGLN